MICAPLVAQRLHGADLQPLLLHHAGHGGQRHQRGHQEEENGEHRGDGLHLIHIGLVRGRSSRWRCGRASSIPELRAPPASAPRPRFQPRRRPAAAARQLRSFLLSSVFRLAVFQLGFCRRSSCGQAVLHTAALRGIQLVLCQLQLQLGQRRGPAIRAVSPEAICFSASRTCFLAAASCCCPSASCFSPSAICGSASAICCFCGRPTACALRRAPRWTCRRQPAPTPAARWRCPAPPSRRATAVCAAEYSACGRVQCRVCGIQLHLRRVPCINGGLGGNRLRGQPLVLRGAACGAHARVHLCLRRVAFGLGCVCPGLRRLIGGLLAGEVRRRRCGVIRFLGCGCGLPQCGQRGRQFRQARFSLGNSGLQCFHKLFGRGKLGLRVGQLLLFVVQQGLVFLDLRFGVDQRGLACRKLLLLLCQSAGQTFLVGLPAPFRRWRSGFSRLSSCAWASSSSARPSSSCSSASASFSAASALASSQLLPGVGQLLLGICFDFVVTGGAARAADRLHPVRHGVHQRPGIRAEALSSACAPATVAKISL